MITRRTALAAGLAAPFIARSTANAQSVGRNETLLLVQEYGPNSLDMQGIGSSQPVNASRLIAMIACCASSPCPSRAVAATRSR